ncbi:hypothetical protein ACIHFE_00360 [Streptomyces sp. NPDC052396]|uniref:hypothetical protein n=1 Tax=Streptomyces sp. NPDC052396 TaxID=3365689 RepID=UPI0037D2D1E7
MTEGCDRGPRLTAGRGVHPGCRHGDHRTGGRSLAAEAWRLAGRAGERTALGIAGPPGAGKSTPARACPARLWYLETVDELRQRRLVERQLAGGRDAAGAPAWVRGNDGPHGDQVEASRANTDRIVAHFGLDMTIGGV